MNAKSIYEVLAALGAGAFVAGCNSASDSRPEVTPVAEVFTASPTAKAPIVAAPPASTVDNTATAASAAAQPVAVVPGPTPAARAKPTAELPATTVPAAREAAAPASTPLALATPVPSARPTPTATTTAKKRDPEMKCGQGACG